MSRSSIDVTKSPVSLGTCNKNLLIRKRSFMFPRKVDETEHDKEKAITTTVTMETKRIPIYVHFSTQRYIIYITNDSLRDIQKGFSSVLTLDIVSVFGRERFSSVLTLYIVSGFGIMDFN
jgi:hypothetical protein